MRLLVRHYGYATFFSFSSAYYDPALVVSAAFFDDDGKLLSHAADTDVFMPSLNRYFFFGVHQPGHFSLVAVDNARLTYTHYDLLHKKDATCGFAASALNVLRNLWSRTPDLQGQPRGDFPPYEFEMPLHGIAKQINNVHCGPIALCVAECILRAGVPPSAIGVSTADRGGVGPNTFFAGYRRKFLHLSSTTLHLPPTPFPPSLALLPPVQGAWHSPRQPSCYRPT
jgi:hypothetical protein